MNPQAVVDRIRPALLAQGWQSVALADSLEPDPELAELPAAFVYHGPIRPRGETQTDNFVQQTVQEFIGVNIACKRSELAQRQLELSDALLGAQLEADGFAVQYAEGKPLYIGRDLYWWAEAYFTESLRRQTA